MSIYVGIDEIFSENPSQRSWRSNPDAAFAGDTLISSETSPAYDGSNPILALATSDPTRFRFLVSHLPPLLQDIFFQYYLLGRTHAQIGLLLFPNRSPHGRRRKLLYSIPIGARALAAIASCNGDTDSLTGAARIAFDEARNWNPPTPRRTIVVRAHRDLGAFVITPNGQLSELFAPSWSVAGACAGKGVTGC